MMTLEERNRLAESIVDQGGVWLLPFNGRTVEVRPIAVVVTWTGKSDVRVMAINGKPFVQKVDWGEGICKTRTAYKYGVLHHLEIRPIHARIGDFSGHRCPRSGAPAKTTV